jgi:hypothetical protein
MKRALRHCLRAAVLAASAVGTSLLAGCTTTAGTEPQEYLDERTAATVTVGAKALVLARERPEYAVNARDYLSLWPVDVNRMGKHDLYFYGYAWSTIDKRAAGESAGKFELLADGRRIALTSSSSKPRSLGFGAPAVEAPAGEATLLIVPTTREVLKFVSSAGDVWALRTRDGLAERFELWEDGRAAIDEFLAGAGPPR